MSFSGIHGQLLEVTVVSCSKLKDTEWISRQDPYVCLEYGSTKFRTRTCTDGHKNPTFQEKFVFTLIEGLRELNAVVWNSNSMSSDDFIGNGKIQLQKVLSQGYDDCSWTLQTKTDRYAGEVRLILHYASANKPAAHYAPSAPQYMTPPPIYSAQPPVSSASYPSPYNTYSAPPSYPPSYPPSSAAYPPQPTGYPSAPYPPQPSAYPPAPYPPQTTAYPPAPYPPQTTYPPASASHYPPSPFPGLYPPPHY